MKITLEQAKKVIEAAKVKAIEINVPMNIAIADDGGNLKAFEKMDGSILASTNIAINKAYTAVACNNSTENIASATQPNQSLFGLHTTNDCRIVIFGGGIPLYVGIELVGAIGVSGGSVEEDVSVAVAGAATFNK